MLGTATRTSSAQRSRGNLLFVVGICTACLAPPQEHHQPNEAEATSSSSLESAQHAWHRHKNIISPTKQRQPPLRRWNLHSMLGTATRTSSAQRSRGNLLF